MIYLFFNNKTQNYKPEINYGDGHNLAFKKGWFLFDEEKQHRVSFWKVDGTTMMIDGDPYIIKQEYVYKHPIKAEIAFLRLKIIEMKNSSFDFFMPITYAATMNRFNELKENHPEYVL